VKSPIKLQQKLKSLLSKSELQLVLDFDKPWDNLTMKEVASVVQNYVNRNTEVIEDDNALRDWLDKYKFFIATNNLS